MTREEAKGNLIHAIRWNTITKKEAIDIAIKALEQDPICPSAGIDCEDCPAYDPCGDVISRQAVLDIVDGYSVSQSNVEDVTQDIISDIMVLPSVNPQPKTGRWIIPTQISHVPTKFRYKCGCCNGWVEYITNFCPFCGARMESEG